MIQESLTWQEREVQLFEAFDAEAERLKTLADQAETTGLRLIAAGLRNFASQVAAMASDNRRLRQLAKAMAQ